MSSEINVEEIQALPFLEKIDSLKGLSRHRYEFILARLEHPTIAGAAEAIGMSRSWYYSFSKEQQQELESIIADLKAEPIRQANMILQEEASSAALTLVEGLQSRSPHVRVKAAAEILDRIGVKSGDSLDVTGTVKHTASFEETLEAVYGSDPVPELEERNDM